MNLPRTIAMCAALGAPYTPSTATAADPYREFARIANNPYDPVYHDRMGRIAASLEQFEGFRPEVYMDTTGHPTIGFGHKLDAQYIAHAPIDRDRAREMLHSDVYAAENGARRVFPQLATLAPAAQEALIHMAFQLGTTGLSRFVNLKKALSLNPPNYNLAAVECIHSRWCQQTPTRARFCAALFGSIK